MKHRNKADAAGCAPWLLVAADDNRRRNPVGMFRDRHGILHPLRGSSDYSPKVVEQREKQRELTGLSSADQQLESEFGRAIEREQMKETEIARLGPLEERVNAIDRDRCGLRDALASDPASGLTGLVRATEVGQTHDALSYALVRQLTGGRPERFKSSTKVINGKKYVDRRAAIGDKARELGFDSSEDLIDHLEKVAKTRKRLAALDRRYVEAKLELKRAKSTRRNPTTSDKPTIVRRLLVWLRGDAASRTR